MAGAGRFACALSPRGLPAACALDVLAAVVAAVELAGVVDAGGVGVPVDAAGGVAGETTLAVAQLLEGLLQFLALILGELVAAKGGALTADEEFGAGRSAAGGAVAGGGSTDLGLLTGLDDVLGPAAHRLGDAARSGHDADDVLDRLETALVATGFGYEADRRALQAEVLVRALPRVRDIRRAGAAALDLCSVACGRVDGYYERGLKPWDWAAGRIVASEAGAAVRELSDEPSGLVVASPGIADELVAAVT